MNKAALFLFAVLALLVFARPVQAVPAYVSGHFVESSGTSCGSGLYATCVLPAFSSNTTIGNYLVLIGFQCHSFGCNVAEAVDFGAATAQGDTFTKCFDAYTAGSDIARYAIFYAKVSSAGTAVITVTPTGTAYYGTFMAAEFSGVKSATPCDAATGARNIDTGTAIAYTGAAATAECNELIVGNLANGATGASSVNGGTISIGTLSSAGWRMAYKVGSSSVTQTETLSASNSSSVAWDAIGDALKSTSGTCGGGGGGGSNMGMLMKGLTP